MPEQSAEDALVGLLRVRVGTSEKEVPTLKANHVAAWAGLVVGSDGPVKPLSEWTAGDAGTFGGQQVERMLDLIVAYDRTGALGGREWLGENADPKQLRAALDQMADNAFPFGNAPALVELGIMRGAVLSVPPSSTNGASTSGTSTRRRSGRGSTPRR
jgi:hypothetical protein